MEEGLDVFIDQFYGKYSPNDIPAGERRLRLKEKLSSDFDGYVSQMYNKYAPDNIPDSARLSNLRTKYLPKPVEVDPRVASAFAPQQRYKEFERERSKLVAAEVADVQAFAEARKKELQAIATPDNIEALNKQFREEVTYYAGQADAKVNNASKELFDPVQEAITAPPPEQQGFWSSIGNATSSFVVDQIPQFLAQNVQRTQSKFFEGLPEDQLTPEQLEQKRKMIGGAEQFIAGQKEQAAEKLKGVTQDIRDIDSATSLLSFIGNSLGQAGAQIPLSVLSGGSSSYLQESAAVYDEQIDKIAEDKGITRQEVVQQGLDSPAAGQAFAILAAALDRVGAGKVLNTFKSAVLKNVGIEAITEGFQDVLEQTGSNVGTDRGILEQIDLGRSASAGVSGAIGAGPFSVTSAVLNRTNDVIEGVPVPPEVAVEQDKALADTLEEIKVEAPAEIITEEATDSLDRTTPIVEEIEVSNEFVEDEDTIAEQGVDAILEDAPSVPKASLGLITNPEILSKPYEGTKKIEDAQKPIATRLEKLNELMNCLYS